MPQGLYGKAWWVEGWLTLPLQPPPHPHKENSFGAKFPPKNRRPRKHRKAWWWGIGPPPLTTHGGGLRGLRGFLASPGGPTCSRGCAEAKKHTWGSPFSPEGGRVHAPEAEAASGWGGKAATERKAGFQRHDGRRQTRSRVFLSCCYAQGGGGANLAKKRGHGFDLTKEATLRCSKCVRSKGRKQKLAYTHIPTNANNKNGILPLL